MARTRTPATASAPKASSAPSSSTSSRSRTALANSPAPTASAPTPRTRKAATRPKLAETPPPSAAAAATTRRTSAASSNALSRLGSGRAAERAVARYLAERGFQILAVNLRLQYLELDVVARLEDLVVVVEVRTRGHGAWT